MTENEEESERLRNLWIVLAIEGNGDVLARYSEIKERIDALGRELGIIGAELRNRDIHPE